MGRGFTYEAAGTTVEYVRSRRVLRLGTQGQDGFAEVAPATLLRELGIDLAELAPARQFLLFAGTNAPPAGGLGDLVAVFRSEADARDGFRQARLGGASGTGWAELVALDASGRLRR